MSAQKWDQYQYLRDSDLFRGLVKALRRAKLRGESGYVEVEEDIVEVEEEATEEDIKYMYHHTIPSALKEYLEAANLVCEVYHFVGDPGRMYEYVAVCDHKMTGSSYTIYFDIDYDYEVGLVRVVGVEAVAGAHKPGPYYKQVPG